MYKLVISDDEGKNTVVPLVRDEITIGRKEGNTIRLTERNVSRRHARLVKANGRFVIEDLHSYNGVRVNGSRIGAETALDPGDQIQIGDYQIALQVDAAEGATLPEHAAPAVADADTAMLAAPGPPARLVMITPPAPGAEFALTGERVRIGRAEDLDVWVNHRSISREHAEIQKEPDGGLRLIDLGSANGVRVNGQDVQNALLGAGDVVELGQVRFRFVAAGEHYAFDADRTVQMDAVAVEQPSSNRTPILFAGLIVVVAVIGAGVVALWGGDDPEPTVRPLDEQSTARADDLDPQPAAGPSYDDALAACRAALAQAQIANAVAQADVALRARPGDPDATSCRTSATALQPQQQTFDRGLAHFQQGRLQEAYFEFANLPEGSPFRSRPQVAQAVQGFANAQIDAANQIMAASPAEALRLAQFVLGMDGITPNQRSTASAIERVARERGAASEGETRPPQQQVAAVRPPRQGTQQGGTGRNPQGQSPRGGGGTQENGGGSQQATATPTRGGGTGGAGAGITPAELDARVRQALISGNNTEVIRLLEGNARTEWQLQTLIETYRARGQTQQALRHMRTYVGRFSNTPRARQYQQILNSHGQ